MFNKINSNLSILILLFFIILATSTVLGHGVHLDAHVEGNKIIAEASYSDGSAIKNADLNIYDEHGHRLSTFQTDESGKAEFKIPVLEDLELVLNDNLGHRSQYIIKKSKLPPELNNSAPESGIEAEKRTNRLNEEKLRNIISEELNKKLAPITNDLDKLSRSGPGITEIIGGIGYIFGLMGLYLYFKKRKN